MWNWFCDERMRPNSYRSQQRLSILVPGILPHEDIGLNKTIDLIWALWFCWVIYLASCRGVCELEIIIICYCVGSISEVRPNFPK